MNRARAEPPAPESALAAEMFDHLCAAGTMKQILALHREICNTLNLKPNRLPDFYPILKSKLSCSWKAQALFKKFDARANHKVYSKGRACAQTRVLIIGAGPCGLRAAIECQLLGAKVVVVEKRDRMSRNNVLHLWPFVIQDLRALGAKKFLGKFCAGSIDHISIRQLQCILMKVSLLLGVELHEGVSFEELLEPTVTENNETLGWRARVLPADHPVCQYEFDTLIGADGRRNTLHGFKRKEFRGKLAMAITANFINRHSEQEASVPEISGVAFIFNQKFFKDLYEETGIDLENIVYYKDDTHYFVMTAKKHSLLDKGVLLKDFSDVSRLLDVENVDRAALMRYAQEAARFSTDDRLPLRDFALNHYGEPDVALFDFTSMYAAENASLVIERHNHRILCQLVGDSLLEPFWPTGSGCARGFLSALDAAWAVRAWGQAPQPHPLHVIAERESIYRLLAQTTPGNLNHDFGGYTLEPGTRYRTLNRGAVTPHRVTGFYDTDDPQPLDAIATPRKRRREAEVPDHVLLTWVGAAALKQAAAAGALSALLRRYRPDLLPPASSAHQVYQALHHHFGIAPLSSSGSLREPSETKVRAYLTRIYHALKGEVPHVHHESDVFDQMKQSIQKEKHARNSVDQSLYMYTNAAESEKSHSSYRKKRRAVRAPQVSNETEEYIRKKIGKLHLDEISQLARLIDGHDAVVDPHAHKEKQKTLQDEILALLDEDEAPHPKMIRETLAQLLHEPTTPIVTQPKPKAPQPEPKARTKRHVEEAKPPDLQKFFAETSSEQKPVKQQRKLKGLDLNSMNFPDLSDILDDIDVEPAVKPQRKLKGLDFDSMRFPDLSNLLDDVDLDTAVVPSPDVSKKKDFSRSSSTECRVTPSVAMVPFGRSNSIGAPESVAGARRIAEIYESSKRRHSQSPKPRSVVGASTFERALKWQGMSEVQGRTRIPVPRMKRDSFGNQDMGVRRQKVSELIQGPKPQRSASPDYVPRRRNSGEVAFKVQRHSDMMQRHKTTDKKKGGGRRKAAREIMKQRFDKSLQMLAAEPRLDFASSADLENDYGLQQYRASAPHFGERVKKLEQQLQHYEEGRIVAGGGRSAGGGGVRVARLAAELAGTTAPSAAKSSKPKDLLRSVGKIEREDWNVKEIERKILENRLGRPEPRNAEKVPKWDREQFLGRQRRLKEGESQEKWGQIDETLHKLDQKLRDSGRPDHGTKKVANLANKFVKQVEEPAKDRQKEKEKEKEREETKRTWHGGAGAGATCAACNTRVFAAESVTADGLRLHRACFRCALCNAVLRPGNYTMERNGTRLICLRHSGASVPDSGPPRAGAPAMTPERISLEASDHCAREIDEDEWTVSNFLASETSGAGGLSDEDESSSDEYTDVEESSAEAEAGAEADPVRPPRLSPVYLSDDSFGYDDFSDDGASSSGNESCSRMRDALEARRREVPAEPPPPTDSSEVESEEESSSSSDGDLSSGTGVSTDSEFASEEAADSAPAPAILVTEAPAGSAPAPAPTPPPLCRARSTGGLATKRALELKRKYLLGEASPPDVRRSDSTSQLDTKLEAFRSNICEFQKMLNPAPPAPQPRPVVAYTLADRPPMPDIVNSLCDDAPVDLFTKIADLDHDQKQEETEDDEECQSCSAVKGGDTADSSDDSRMETAAPPVPRLEVHDEGGDLIQLDSLMIINNEQPAAVNPQREVNATPESQWSGSCRDVSDLTGTDLSDWAAESIILEDCASDDDKKAKSRSAPKTVHDAKNILAITSHVCGRSSPPQPVDYANALEHFQFADEEDQDPSIATPPKPRNEGYMELVDHEEHPYSPVNDRSMNFIERSFSETIIAPHAADPARRPHDDMATSTDSESTITRLERPITDLKSPQLLVTIESSGSEKSIANSAANNNENRTRNTDESKESVSQATSSSNDVAQAPNAGEHSSEPLAEVAREKPAHSTSEQSVRSTAEQSTREQCSHSTGEQVVRSASEQVIRSVSEQVPRSASKHDARSASEQCARSASEHSARCTHSQSSETSPPLAGTPDLKSPLPMPIVFSTLKLYAPICRSASETFSRSRSPVSPSQSLELSVSFNLSSGSISPECARTTTDKVQEIKREREEQTEVVRRLVLERLGASARGSRRGPRRARAPALPPPVPPPPLPPLPPALPPPPLPVTPSFSDPELARETRKKNIIRSLSNYLNRRLGPRTKWVSEPDLSQNQEPRPAASRTPTAHKSCGGLEQAPPVPPPPARYYPPEPLREPPPRPTDVVERDAMQLWFEARWARLMAQRHDDRRLARLERRLRRPLSAEQQAAAVAELVQVSAQREAHEALMSADRRRCMMSGSACE